MEEWVKVYEEEIAFVPNKRNYYYDNIEFYDDSIEFMEDYIQTGDIKTNEERMNEKIMKEMEKYKNWLNEMLEEEGIYYINKI